MEAHSSVFSIEAMSEILQVSRSGFYEWLNRGLSNRGVQDGELFKVIENLFYKFRRRYGSDRIFRELLDLGYRISRKRVARLMAENGLFSIYNVRKKVKTTISDHAEPPSPNLLNRNFRTDKPNQAWVSDITYIESDRGWLYLCTIKDLFSSKVVGWSLADHMKTELVLDAFRMAVSLRSPDPGLIFHSDRGVQYCSRAFRDALTENGFLSSMSRKGNCWDNAPAESFFATLKCELIYHVKIKNLDHARSLIFDYIEFFYNRIRKHSSLGYKSPVMYEKIAA
jgi:putative transposase